MIQTNDICHLTELFARQFISLLFPTHLAASVHHIIHTQRKRISALPSITLFVCPLPVIILILAGRFTIDRMYTVYVKSTNKQQIYADTVRIRIEGAEKSLTLDYATYILYKDMYIHCFLISSSGSSTNK